LTSSFEHQLIAQKANQILAIDVAKYKNNLAKEIESQKKSYIQELTEQEKNLKAQFRADSINDPKSNFSKMASIDEDMAEILSLRYELTEEEQAEYDQAIQDVNNLGKENKEGMEELKAEALGEEALTTTDNEMTSGSETEEL
jgi:thiamine biosynthesis lipoprotein ApbE